MSTQERREKFSVFICKFRKNSGIIGTFTKKSVKKIVNTLTTSFNKTSRVVLMLDFKIGTCSIAARSALITI
jgi:hypothetical protein